MKQISFFDAEKIYSDDGTLIAVGFSFGENSPKAFITTKNALSMKFRWDENNPNRKKIFNECGIDFDNVVSVELNHTKTVYAVENPFDTKDKIGDGLISNNRRLTLSVTVADCMPIYFYDSVTECFGIVHSGWKGTGIIENAIKKAKEIYNAKPENIKVILGPHIKNCCYEIDANRSEYFKEIFCHECVTEITKNKFMLSLEKANIAVLKRSGIKEENIICSADCTCCNTNLGSFRRECVLKANTTLNFSDPNEPPENFTRMAAFICYKK